MLFRSKSKQREDITDLHATFYSNEQQEVPTEMLKRKNEASSREKLLGMSTLVKDKMFEKLVKLH